MQCTNRQDYFEQRTLTPGDHHYCLRCPTFRQMVLHLRVVGIHLHIETATGNVHANNYARAGLENFCHAMESVYI